MGVFGIGNHLPLNIHLQIGANGQDRRCNSQRRSVMETFKMRGKEKGGIVEFGKGVGGFDDGIAKALENGLVERVEDGVLENDVSDVVSLACRSGFSSLGDTAVCIWAWVSVPSMPSMEIKAASS